MKRYGDYPLPYLTLPKRKSSLVEEHSIPCETESPLKKICYPYLAIVFTFSFSGFIHDLVGLLIYSKMSFLFTTWFIIMGIVVVIFKGNRLFYKTQKKAFNCGLNVILIVTSFLLAKWILKGFYFS